jgi:rRNA maturation protein Nop10
MRNIRKSRATELVAYLIDEQGKVDRVDAVTVTNCVSDDPAMAAIEIEATQRQNTRVTGDRTFHLLVSFPAGEVPTPAVLRDIEQTLCAGIGYADHQRVSVVHTDTDNFHLHICINKIHPKKLTLHDPHQSYRKLLKLCDRLEDRHGLQKDNHTPKKTQAENRAADMERSAGVESLITWIRRECAPALAQAPTWSAFHAVLAEHGLTVRERANGLVFGATNGVFVRASAVDRALSRPSLERRLGAFAPAAPAPPSGHAPGTAGAGPTPPPDPPPPREAQAPPVAPSPGAAQAPPVAPSPGAAQTPPVAAPAKRYAKAPVAEVSSTALWARYLADQTRRDADRRAFAAKQTDRLRSSIDAAAKFWRLKRLLIRHTVKGPLMKRFLYAQAKRTFENRVKKLRRAHKTTLEAARPSFARRSWYQWLQHEAKTGDREALAVLASRPAGKPYLAGLPVGHVTKDGAVSYRVGRGAIRDDGRRFTLSVGADDQTMRVALIRAIQRSGPAVSVTGTDAFRDRMVEIAAASRLPIAFTDPALDARRRAIMEELYVRRHRDDPAAEQRRGAGPDRTAAGNAERAAAGKPDAPNVGRVGTRPPPQARNHLRHLSQLGVVRIGGGIEVLLPGHVPGDVGKREAPGADPVRRDIPRAGRGLEPPAPPVPQPSDPAGKYIAERNAKRSTIPDIPEHRRHTAADAGPVEFTGLREIDGQPLALLRRAGQIAVVPVTSYAAARLKQAPIGSTVHLHRNGQVRVTSRSRSR